MSTFGERLRATREKRGISGRALDAAADLCPGQCSQMERGVIGNPSAKTVFAIAEALGVSAEWLYTGGR